MTAIAAVPAGPSDCPIAITSTKLYTDVTTAPMTDAARYFQKSRLMSPERSSIRASPRAP